MLKIPFPKLNRNTKIMGLGSFLVDMSSEMIFPLLPFFITMVLGGPAFAVGLMEGLGEFSVAISSILSGLYSDKIGKRKKIILFGYSLSALFKGFLLIVTTWPQVVLLKIVERVGKGMRDSPRDALIALSEKREILGEAYGFRKFLDNLGATIGPLIATLIIAFFFGNSHDGEAYRFLFMVALIPAALAIVALFFLKEKESVKKPTKLNLEYISKNKEVRNFSILMAIFTLGQFSLMLFLLKAGEFMSLVFIPVFYLIFNVAYTTFSLPAGIMIDKMGSKKTMIIGMLLFATAVALIALIPSPAILFLSFILIGFQMAISETVPSAFLVKRTEEGSYATAIGFYKAAVGISALPANLIAGILWTITVFGIPSAFLFSFIVSMVSVPLFYFSIEERK